MSDANISDIQEEEAQRAEEERDVERTYVLPRPPESRSQGYSLPYRWIGWNSCAS